MKSISVIIVNFNGINYLEECLNSIEKNNYPNLEVIVLDNNSNDGSQELVKRKFPKVTLIEEKNNLGFAGGNNVGFKHSKGEIICLLNNDTKIEENFFKEMVKVFDVHPKCGVAQSKIVLYSNKDILDCAGSFWSPTTILYHYGFQKNANLKEFNESYKIFSAKGASMLIKREVIEEVGFFDDDFWHYYEETDFCHRVINSGKEVWYYPKATCFHKIGVSRDILDQEDKIVFVNTRNKFISFYKNFYTTDLIYVLLKYYLVIGFYIIILLSNRQFKQARIYLKAVTWSLINIKTLLKKRDENKFKGTEKELPRKKFNYLFYFHPDRF